MATEPFYGDPATSAKVWSKWAVLRGSLTATMPSGTPAGGVVDTRGFILNNTVGPITTEWAPMGALDEDNPFGDGEESMDVTPHTAAGFGVFAKTYKNQEETIEFTALETTLRTLGLIYDTTDLAASAGIQAEGKLKQRDPAEKFLIGFVRENSTEMERRVSENYAVINTITRNATDGRSTYTVNTTIYPTALKELYDYYLGDLS